MLSIDGRIHKTDFVNTNCLQERKLGGSKFEIKGVILLFTLWVL